MLHLNATDTVDICGGRLTSGRSVKTKIRLRDLDMPSVNATRAICIGGDRPKHGRHVETK